MKTYKLLIKSHSEAPDMEAETEARSKEEASEIFAEQGFLIMTGRELLRYVIKLY